jgi:hypothetical protein
VEHLTGNTVGAIKDAVDQAYCVVYCLSVAYKESANARLEAMYAHHSQVPMVPVMLSAGYGARCVASLVRAGFRI